MGAFEFMQNFMSRPAPANWGDDEDDERQKLELREEFLARRQSQEFARSITASYVQLYENAQTETERKHRGRQLEQVVGRLSPQDRQVVMPLLTATPLDPAEVSKERYRKAAGERPQLDFSYEENKILFAQRLFQQRDWDAGLQGVITGARGDTPAMLGLPSGELAYRHSSGMIGIYTQEQMLAVGKAAGMKDVSPATLVAQQGVHYGDPVSFVVNGREFEVRAGTNLFEPDKRVEPIIKETSGQLQRDRTAGAEGSRKRGSEFSLAEIKAQQELAVAFARQDDEHPVVKVYKRQVEGGYMSKEDFAREFLAPYWPGHVVAVVKTEGVDRWPFGDSFELEKGSRIVALPGLPAEHPDGSGNMVVFDPVAETLIDMESGREINWKSYGASNIVDFYRQVEESHRKKAQGKKPSLMEEAKSYAVQRLPRAVELKGLIDPKERPVASEVERAVLKALVSPTLLIQAIQETLNGTYGDEDLWYFLAARFSEWAPWTGENIRRSTERKFPQLYQWILDQKKRTVLYERRQAEEAIRAYEGGQ